MTKDVPLEELPEEQVTECGKSWQASCSRIVGLVFFLMPVLLVVTGYGIGFGCSSCYGEKGTPLVLYERMLISDTLKRSPTKWTGRVFLLVALISGFLLGSFRYFRLRSVSSASCGNISIYNRLLVSLLSVAGVFVIGVGMAPAKEDLNIHNVHLFSLVGMTACITGYDVVHVFVIERSLLKDGLIGRKHHVIRCRFIKLAVTGTIMAFTAIVVGRSGDMQVQDAMFKIFRTVDLVGEVVAVLALSAILGLTDFAWMPIYDKGYVTGDGAC